MKLELSVFNILTELENEKNMGVYLVYCTCHICDEPTFWAAVCLDTVKLMVDADLMVHNIVRRTAVGQWGKSKDLYSVQLNEIREMACFDEII